MDNLPDNVVPVTLKPMIYKAIVLGRQIIGQKEQDMTDKKSLQARIAEVTEALELQSLEIGIYGFHEWGGTMHNARNIIRELQAENERLRRGHGNGKGGARWMKAKSTQA